jgi:hypothetical protein
MVGCRLTAGRGNGGRTRPRRNGRGSRGIRWAREGDRRPVEERRPGDQPPPVSPEPGGKGRHRGDKPTRDYFVNSWIAVNGRDAIEGCFCKISYRRSVTGSELPSAASISRPAGGSIISPPARTRTRRREVTILRATERAKWRPAAACGGGHGLAPIHRRGHGIVNLHI